MRHEDIQPGMTLKLKREAVKRYGGIVELVTVTDKRTKGSYRTPWIYSGTNAYKPSDFERVVYP